MWGTENIALVLLLGGAAFIANSCYAMGGTEGFGLFWRRVIGSAFLALAANVGAFMLNVWQWPYLLFWPLLAIGFSLPYGADTTIEKVIKRTVFALGVLSCCVLGMWMNSFNPMSWVLGGLALITGLTSVILGVINPFNNAPLEQFIISQVLTMYVPFWAFCAGGK